MPHTAKRSPDHRLKGDRHMVGGDATPGRGSAGRSRAAAAVAAVGLVGAALALPATFAGAATAQLLANAGFETGDLGGWACAGSSQVSSAAPHGGGYALSSVPGAQDIAPCSQTVAVQPGAAYVLSAWVKGGYVRLSAAGTGVSASNWTAGTAWTQLATSFTAGPQTTSVTVTVSGWYGSGAVAVDDVALTGAAGTTSASPTTTATVTASPTASTASPTVTATASPTATATTAPGVVRVTSSKELKAALAAAVPGQTIQLADGTYTGNFVATTPGTADRRITLVGSANAVLTTSTGGGYGLHLDGAGYWTVKGITVTGAQKGIVTDAADYVVIDSVTVRNLTMEGVHFRNSSRYGVLKNSTIRDTGTLGDGKGEGVYVGTANTLTDRSDHVQILDNVIGPRIGAENVDLKEGTTGGLVSGNTFYGDGLTNKNFDDSWVDVKGNDYVVENNTGIGTLNDGFQTHTQDPGWGCGTVFRHNAADLTGATGTGRYAFDITNYDAVSCPVTVTADNAVTGGDGLVNPGIPVR